MARPVGDIASVLGLLDMPENRAESAEAGDGRLQGELLFMASTIPLYYDFYPFTVQQHADPRRISADLSRLDYRSSRIDGEKLRLQAESLDFDGIASHITSSLERIAGHAPGTIAYGYKADDYAGIVSSAARFGLDRRQPFPTWIAEDTDFIELLSGYMEALDAGIESPITGLEDKRCLEPLGICNNSQYRFLIHETLKRYSVSLLEKRIREGNAGEIADMLPGILSSLGGAVEFPEEFFDSGIDEECYRKKLILEEFVNEYFSGLSDKSRNELFYEFMKRKHNRGQSTDPSQQKMVCRLLVDFRSRLDSWHLANLDWTYPPELQNRKADPYKDLSELSMLSENYLDKAYTSESLIRRMAMLNPENSGVFELNMLKPPAILKEKDWKKLLSQHDEFMEAYLGCERMIGMIEEYMKAGYPHKAEAVPEIR